VSHRVEGLNDRNDDPGTQRKHEAEGDRTQSPNDKPPRRAYLNSVFFYARKGSECTSIVREVLLLTFARLFLPAPRGVFFFVTTI
jgi:hypothetical protein